MKSALSESGPLAGLYAALRYHLGWSDAQGRPVGNRTAKGVRPRLCLLACHALSGSARAAEQAAAAVELTHEFSLIHDDVEDGDAVRRGRATLWMEVGIAQAINAGDALFAIARMELLRSEVSADVALEMVRRYDAATLRLAEGQHLDLSAETACTQTVSAYEAMAEGKTGALLGLAAALGALAAGYPGAAAAMEAFGRTMGVGFQIADDVLGLWGDPRVTGKPAGADLVRGKKSYPVVLALADERLARLVHESRSGEPGRVAAALAELESAGYRRRATEAALEKVAEAVGYLENVDLSPNGRAALAELAGIAVARIR
jgi:geranylgeranyl diphosphate synthase type I